MRTTASSIEILTFVALAAIAISQKSRGNLHQINFSSSRENEFSKIDL